MIQQKTSSYTFNKYKNIVESFNVVQTERLACGLVGPADGGHSPFPQSYRLSLASAPI